MVNAAVCKTAIRGFESLSRLRGRGLSPFGRSAVGRQNSYAWVRVPSWPQNAAVAESEYAVDLKSTAVRLESSSLSRGTIGGRKFYQFLNNCMEIFAQIFGWIGAFLVVLASMLLIRKRGHLLLYRLYGVSLQSLPLSKA